MCGKNVKFVKTACFVFKANGVIENNYKMRNYLSRRMGETENSGNQLAGTICQFVCDELGYL